MFSVRYKALIVEGGGEGYLKTVCDHLQLNPVRAQLLPREDRLLGYPDRNGQSGRGWPHVAATAGAVV